MSIFRQPPRPRYMAGIHVNKGRHHGGARSVRGDGPVVRATRSRPLLAVTGVSFESRIASEAGCAVVCSAGGNDLAASLSAAVAQGARGIVSFGIAGGLCETLAPGDVVIPQTIVSGSRRLPTDDDWTDRLRTALAAVAKGDIVGVNAPAGDVAQKQALRRDTGAIAVDMESHIAAEVAAAHGVPFVALRVVSDPFNCALPPAALLPLGEKGRPDIPAVLRSIAMRPGQMPLLWRTARDVRHARNALLRSCQVLGARFGLPDPG